MKPLELDCFRFFYFSLILLFVLIKVFISITRLSTFKNYNDFVVEGDTIVKYNGSGNVVIPKTIDGVVIKKIGDNAFNGLKIDNVVIPDSITYVKNILLNSKE